MQAGKKLGQYRENENTDMGKIVYLMGKSSSGKDTIFKKLMKEGTMDLRTIVPYTTRPIRAGEENGVEYFFTDEPGFQALKEQGKVIEDRAYNTVYGIWRYFTVDDGQIDLSEQNYLMIGALEAYEKMIAYFGAEAILMTVYACSGHWTGNCDRRSRSTKRCVADFWRTAQISPKKSWRQQGSGTDSRIQI